MHHLSDVVSDLGPNILLGPRSGTQYTFGSEVRDPIYFWVRGQGPSILLGRGQGPNILLGQRSGTQYTCGSEVMDPIYFWVRDQGYTCGSEVRCKVK